VYVSPTPGCEAPTRRANGGFKSSQQAPPSPNGQAEEHSQRATRGKNETIIIQEEESPAATFSSLLLSRENGSRGGQRQRERDRQIERESNRIESYRHCTRQGCLAAVQFISIFHENERDPPTRLAGRSKPNARLISIIISSVAIL